MHSFITFYHFITNCLHVLNYFDFYDVLMKSFPLVNRLIACVSRLGFNNKIGSDIPENDNKNGLESINKEYGNK